MIRRTLVATLAAALLPAAALYQNTIQAGDIVVAQIGPFTVLPHAAWRGRAIDALARPIDGGPPLPQGDPLDAARVIQPSALARQRVGGA